MADGDHPPQANLPNSEIETNCDPAAKISPQLDDEARNAKYIRCIHCSSLILRPGSASFVEKTEAVNLPKTERSLAGTASAVSRFWLVQDIYQFENMSFSKTVDELKYLACADCDIGPIGYQDQTEKYSYIALDRVSHTDK